MRFLLWRLQRYEAKIEIEGLHNLINRLRKSTRLKITSIPLPFIWHTKNINFKQYINKDLDYLEGKKIRNTYKWSELTTKIIEKHGINAISNEFGITNRSVRKWRQGTRIPSPKYRLKLLKWQK